MLITYWDASEEQMLSYFDENGPLKKIYKSRKYHQKDDEYLLIFGPTSNLPIGSRDFIAFSFDGESVEKLEKIKILQE